jgi:hypothetical protein
LSEASRRANLENTIHENNMLEEGNGMVIRVLYGETGSQKIDLPPNVVEFQK